MITSFFAPKGTAKVTPSGKMISEDNTFKRGRDESNESLKRSKRAKLEEVDELLSYLDDGDDENLLGWKAELDRYTSSSSFASLAKFVATERTKETIYPPPQETFAALNLTPLDQVKVVIVGQDPYHGPGQAHGLCFSVRKGVATPPSLKNIFKELSNDKEVNFPNRRGMPRHGFLERWAKQGVLLLNNVLTVKKSDANSHKKRGWEEFTDQVIRVLIRNNKKGLVFLLWGKPASKKAIDILGSNNNNVVVLQSSHPSPLGASKTNSPFLGSKCFSKANKALVEFGLEPVDWNVDEE